MYRGGVIPAGSLLVMAAITVGSLSTASTIKVSPSRYLTEISKEGDNEFMVQYLTRTMVHKKRIKSQVRMVTGKIIAETLHNTCKLLDL